MTELATYTDLRGSLTALAANEHDHDGMLKFREDLERYARIIEATRPEVLVEMGTRTGAAANWFASHDLDVITVDVWETTMIEPCVDRVTRIIGDSVDPVTAAFVADMVAGRRCMVSLDSDHAGPHVTREVELYAPLVTPGCYLVVEDGILGYAHPADLLRHAIPGLDGSPLDAITKHLAGNPDWYRDVDIEQLYPISHNVAGWWVRT